MAAKISYCIPMQTSHRFHLPPFPTLPVLALALAQLFLVTPTAISGTSDWSRFEGGAVRLIASGPLADGRYDTGIEFVLDPGWHTYWENAGEAGIPPQVDWAPSGNLADARLQFPYPERYDDGFSVSNVYKNGIVLPLAVRPERPEDPVQLEIDLTFGNCKDVCVPASARLSLTLDPLDAEDRTSHRAIARARADVPMPAQATDAVVSRLFLRKDGKKEKLDLSLTMPTGMDIDDVEIFASAPQDLSLGVPRRTKPEWKQATGDWVLSLGGLPDDLAMLPLRLVLVAGRHAVEQRFEINRATGAITEIHPARPR